MNTLKTDKERLQNKNTNDRRKLFGLCALIITIIVALIIFFGLFYGCNKKDNTPPGPIPTTSITVTTDYSTLNSTTTSNNVATITANITNPMGDTRWSVSSTQSDFTSYATFAGTTSDATIVTATLTYNTYVSIDIDVTITAMNNDKSNSCMVTLKPEPATPIYSLPVNSIFYTFSGTQGEVVEGFSTSFLEASDTEQNARQYMVDNAGWGVNINDTFDISMDLHGRKITGTQYAFSPQLGDINVNINHIFVNFSELNFANTFWQWNNGISGYNTFGVSVSYAGLCCDFHNVTILNLKNAHFAIDDNKPIIGQSATASYTFCRTIFTNLISLDLRDAIFAIANSDLDGVVATGYFTFYNIEFNELISLNLSGSVFSKTHMNRNSGGIGSSTMTGGYTFYYDTFPKLSILNLNNVSFASSDMNPFGRINSAAYTFGRAIFTSLTTLDLHSVLFATNNTEDGGYTNFAGSGTFEAATFTRLTTLNLGNCQLQLSDNINVNGLCSVTFNGLVSSDWSEEDKLNISGTIDWDADVTMHAQLDTWFGEDCWNFTQY